jgi:hypothetical protein
VTAAGAGNRALRKRLGTDVGVSRTDLNHRGQPVDVRRPFTAKARAMPSASSASTRMVVTQPKLRWSWTKLSDGLPRMRLCHAGCSSSIWSIGFRSSPVRRAKQLNLQIAADRREQDDEHSMMPAAGDGNRVDAQAFIDQKPHYNGTGGERPARSADGPPMAACTAGPAVGRRRYRSGARWIISRVTT